MTGKTRTIAVNYLARVEGEGALHVVIDQGKVTDVKLKIFEPPRFFEAFMRGRSVLEAPDITARICGICPVAYQMSAVQAIERALDLTLPPHLLALRRLLYCGEWIESHVLHIYMLHAPDFHGVPDVVHLAKKDRGAVERGLRLKRLGNRIVQTLGGREIHPINVRVGGFYRLPTVAEMTALSDELIWGRQAALDTLQWVSRFNFPIFSRDYEFVSLVNDSEYPMYSGKIGFSKGDRIDVSEFEQLVEEEHITYTNALHAKIKGRGAYLTGPLARFSQNFEQLHPEVQAACRKLDLAPPCQNPFRSIMVRAVEVLQAIIDAERVVREYRAGLAAHVEVAFRESRGWGATEAPRGLLYHSYAMDESGAIKDARIIPPTSQNQKSIEEDLWGVVTQSMSLSDDKLRERCEVAIRNYDPCISCATHFLQLHVQRRD